MYAQRKSSSAPRSNGRHGGFQRAPIRARMGLLMRRSQDFGPLGDAEPSLRNVGLSLAPMSIDDTSMSLGGITILPTAKTSDIDSGALKGLVVPGGSAETDAGSEALKDAVTRTLAKGAPVLAFGEGVASALRAAGRDPAEFADYPAVLIQSDGVRPLVDMDAVTEEAKSIG